MLITPNYFEEYTRDFQLPMGPTLSKGTLDKVHLIVLIYTPSIILFFFILGSLIFYLWVPILALATMLPSVIRYHTGRFIGAVQRCASLCPLPFPVAVLIQASKSAKGVLWTRWFTISSHSDSSFSSWVGTSGYFSSVFFSMQSSKITGPIFPENLSSTHYFAYFTSLLF